MSKIHIALIVGLLATVGYSDYVNLDRQVVRSSLPTKVTINGSTTHNPSYSLLFAAGWRTYDSASIPPVSNGWIRVSSTYVQDPEDANAGILDVVDIIDTDAAADAAEVASLASDLTNAVNVAFGVMPPYSENVQSQYRTLLRNQMKQARADVDAASNVAELKAAQKTLNQRQEIINLIREILTLKPSWTLGEL